MTPRSSILDKASWFYGYFLRGNVVFKICYFCNRSSAWCSSRLVHDGFPYNQLCWHTQDCSCQPSWLCKKEMAFDTRVNIKDYRYMKMFMKSVVDYKVWDRGEYQMWIGIDSLDINCLQSEYFLFSILQLQSRVKLDSIYCKFLLSFDNLSKVSFLIHNALFFKVHNQFNEIQTPNIM